MALSTYDYFLENKDFIFKGLIITLQVFSYSIFFGFILGLIAALAKLSKFPLTKIFAIIYIEIFRGTPLLVQIFFMAFAYPTILREKFNIDTELGTWSNPLIFWDVVIILSLNTGAYQAEIIRAGIESIPVGQMEAARSIGLSYNQALRYIILPQTFRVIMPPLANEFINLALNTSLVAAVAVKDLTYTARVLASVSFRTLEIYFFIGGIYLSLTLTLSRLFQFVEKKYRIPGLGLS